MSSTRGQSRRIDELIASATSALDAKEWTAAELSACEAMRESHQRADFERMLASVKVLQAARGSRAGAAMASKKVHRISSYEQLDPLIAGEEALESACYLIEPGLVAADGRELRDRALELGVCIFVIVREPKTQLGLWPIVMVGPETIRAKVDPPKKLGVSWIKQASEALTGSALTLLDPEAEASSRVDQSMALLETLVDSAPLHDALLEALDETVSANSSDASKVSSH